MSGLSQGAHPHHAWRHDLGARGEDGRFRRVRQFPALVPASCRVSCSVHAASIPSITGISVAINQHFGESHYDCSTAYTKRPPSL